MTFRARHLLHALATEGTEARPDCMSMINDCGCAREQQISARADRHSHSTEIGSVESGAKLCHATDAQTSPNSAISTLAYKPVESNIYSGTGWHWKEIISAIAMPNMTQHETSNPETTKSSTHDVIPNSKNESIVVSISLTALHHYCADG